MLLVPFVVRVSSCARCARRRSESQGGKRWVGVATADDEIQCDAMGICENECERALKTTRWIMRFRGELRHDYQLRKTALISSRDEKGKQRRAKEGRCKNA